MDKLVYNTGFGIIPKAIMCNTELSSDSKCLFAYFAAYAGNGDTAFPGVSLILYHLGWSKTKFYKYRKELEEKGYLEIYQEKEKGKFSHNVYKLNVMPIDKSKNPPFPKNEDTANWDTENEDTQNEDTIINSFNKNSNIKNNNNISEDKSSNGSSKNKKEREVPYKEIIDYLNLKANKKYKYTKTTISKINARCNEGFTLEDFKQVIDIKCNQWLNDSKMKQYLRPETLFGTKFESYLNEEVSIKGNIQISNTSFEGKSSNDILKEFNIEI